MSNSLGAEHATGHNDQMNSNANCNGNGSANNGFTNDSVSNVSKSNDCDGYAQSSNSPSITTNNASSLQSTSISTPITNTVNSASTPNNSGGAGGDDICRDFLRNVCRRGKACRFKHPDLPETDSLGRKEAFVFCHDFQNRECRRENCRFLHCSRQEEELFRSTGKLPSHVQSHVASEESRNNSTPVCKDFLNGTCRRPPGRCKFRHPPPEPFNNSQPNRNAFDNRNSQRNANYSMCASNTTPTMDYQSHFNRQCGSNMMPSNYAYSDSGYSETPNKRKRNYESMYNSFNSPYSEPIGQVRGYSMHSPNQSYYGAPNQPMERSYLEEENASLRRRLDDLKKQLSDLIASNDFLVEQINQLRVQNAAGPAAAVAVAAAATSVASLQPQAPTAGTVSSTAVGITTPLSLQAQIGPPAAAVIGALPPSSIVSSIASISLPTVTAPVSLVNSSAAASLVSYTPSLHSSNPWPLGVDQ